MGKFTDCNKQKDQIEKSQSFPIQATKMQQFHILLVYDITLLFLHLHTMEYSHSKSIH